MGKRTSDMSCRGPERKGQKSVQKVKELWWWPSNQKALEKQLICPVR